MLHPIFSIYPNKRIFGYSVLFTVVVFYKKYKLVRVRVANRDSRTLRSSDATTFVVRRCKASSLYVLCTVHSSI